MSWNWELPDWPRFHCQTAEILPFEKEFLRGAGGVFAVLKHLDPKDKKRFVVEVLSLEGMKSSEIEGEILERESLQSSIQRHFGVNERHLRAGSKEKGMADLLCIVYETFSEPLSHALLYEWHELLMQGDCSLTDKGIYRTHPEPMQIVSRRIDKERVFYEAPPSDRILREMTRYIEWYNQSEDSLSILEKASIAHVYFGSIHPFEDGNGRIGRALVEKLLSQSLGQPTLIALSQEIVNRKKEYYAYLGECNRQLDATRFAAFFSEVIVSAQKSSLELVNYLISKSKIMQSLEGKMNERQEKVLLRLFAEGPSGFKGGLSSENYVAIAKTSKATATRDLVDLVNKGALRKTGQLRHTRYWLNI